jgi:hypothetical protein
VGAHGSVVVVELVDGEGELCWELLGLVGVEGVVGVVEVGVGGVGTTMDGSTGLRDGCTVTLAAESGNDAHPEAISPARENAMASRPTPRARRARVRSGGRASIGCHGTWARYVTSGDPELSW